MTHKTTKVQRRGTGNGAAPIARASGTPATETTYHIDVTTKGSTVRWTRDAEQLVLKIPRSRLESHLSDLIGQPLTGVVDFDVHFDMTTPRGRSLLASVEFLARELDRPGGISEFPLLREQLEAFVMTQVLLAVRNSYTDLLVSAAQPAQGSRIQPVLDYMEIHVAQPLTPQELAKVGCMSVRALHAAFQQEVGMSPMAHLRRIRLDHVRTELLRCAGQNVRISDIAMRWGFFHPSRFARQYQERFGELPSETLRRNPT
jgi:AraC-like DNA-binding protein